MWLGVTGTPPLECRTYIRRMIKELERTTSALKERWTGHSDIPPRVFGPKQYLGTPLSQPSKPMLTSKPLPASGSVSKLILKETQSVSEDTRRVEVSGGDDAQAKYKAEPSPVNHFMCKFNTISANLDTEVKKKALFASVEATTSVIESEWYDEKESNAGEAASTKGDVRQVIYSAEDAAIGFPPQNHIVENAEQEQQ